MVGGECFGGLAADIVASNDVFVGAPGFHDITYVFGSLAGVALGASDTQASGIHAGV